MEQALKNFSESAFMADELRLFLDTHPNEVRARNDYRIAVNLAESQRAALGYAISPQDAGRGNSWDWIQTPWPWEKEE